MNYLLCFLAGAVIGHILAMSQRRRTEKPDNQIARVVSVRFPDELILIEGEITKVELPEGKRVKFVVALGTARGHAGAVQAGSERWTSSDESVASVEQDAANPLGATVRALDGSNNASVTIEFRADADRGEGVKEIVAATTIVVTQGDAVVATLSPAGMPEDDVDAPFEIDHVSGGDVNVGTTSGTGDGSAALGNPNNVDPVDRIKGDGTPGSGSAPTPPASGAPDGSTTSPTKEAEETGSAAKPIDTGTEAPAGGETTTEGKTFPEAAAEAKASTDDTKTDKPAEDS